ncbi:hypothetical protein MBLNU230_g6470t1 [Neophaeotheca triangularis]
MATPTPTATPSADIPLLITSEHSSSERRITPSWTIAHLKARLEPITGIPATCQKLSLKIASQAAAPIEASDEEATQIASWPLQAYAEIHITDTRPPGLKENYTDVSRVEKYTLPLADYASRPDTVAAYKARHKLGRFDPSAPSQQEQKIANSFREAEERHIAVGKRCRLLPPETDDRRGSVAFVGEVAEIAGAVGAWVGVVLDEPTGRNDGRVGGEGKRYFECKAKCGVFVRPERVEVGDFGVEDEDLMGSEDEF